MDVTPGVRPERGNRNSITCPRYAQLERGLYNERTPYLPMAQAGATEKTVYDKRPPAP